MSAALVLRKMEPREGWSIYEDDQAGYWLRDLELGERAGLAHPRDIRQTITKAIQDGAILDWRAHGRANNEPMFREVTETSRSGKGREQAVTAYYLNREATVVILSRLRTPKAERAISTAVIGAVRVFDALERGELVPAPEPAVDETRLRTVVREELLATLEPLWSKLLEHVSAEVRVTFRDALRPRDEITSGLVYRLHAYEEGRGPEAVEARAPATEPETAVRPNTRRAYAEQWNTFAAWCEERGLVALPAEPATLAEYLTWRTREGYKLASIELGIVAIRRKHRAAGHPLPMADPRVHAQRVHIRKTLGTRRERKAPLLQDALCAMIDKTPTGLAGTRDRALLLVGWLGGFRSSELVALDVHGVRFVKGDLELDSERGPVPLPRHPHPPLCPVRTLRAWLRAGKIRSGPIFRGVDHQGNVGESALCRRTVSRLVKRYAGLAGFNPDHFAAGSLRSGLLASAGLEDRRHKSKGARS